MTVMYSRTHCLIVMPMSAENSAHTRLENQRALMRMLDDAGWNAGLLELLGRVPASLVAFAPSASCWDICCSSWTESWESSS